MEDNRAGRVLLDHLSVVMDVGRALASTPDLLEGLRRVCRVLAGRVCDWCVVDLVAEGGRLDRVCAVHRTPQALPPGGYEGRLPPLPEGAAGPIPAVLRGAGPLLLTVIPPPSPGADPLYARYLELFADLQADSVIVAPLRGHREILGVLTLGRTRPEQRFTQEDVARAGNLVRSLGLQTDNKRLYQETQKIAERFQRALLPRLPDVGHLQLAARYQPSSAAAQVGGDWYDAFVLPGGDGGSGADGGHTVLVIGDVSGHDLQAAVAMSALRNMLRGIAADRREPPGDVLHRVDMASSTLDIDATATCVYALVKGPPQGPWSLHHSSAGHPPPLLINPDGGTRYLEAGAGLLIGVDPGRRRPTGVDPLPPFSTLLLFTDGLIERRGEPLGQGLTRLRRHAAGLAGEPLDVFCDELVSALTPTGADDLAVLAARPVPAADSIAAPLADSP